MKLLFFKAALTGLLLFLVSPALFSAGRRLPSEQLSVGFLRGESRIHLKCSSPIKIKDPSRNLTENLPAEKNFVLTPSSSGILIGRELPAGPEIIISPADNINYLRINGRRYRGSVIIINREGLLAAVNRLDLEGYLKGVLPMEVSPAWPIESLKAQAVASRTYALNNLGKYSERGYDLSADIFSQVYGGVEAESENTSRAVEETRGEILVYNGRPGRAYFHSSCGGHTENIKDVWGSKINYLKGVRCTYCADSPRSFWELELNNREMARALGSTGLNISSVTGIKTPARTGSGRAGRIFLIHPGGEIKSTGHRLRMAVGPNKLKSALFAVSTRGSSFFFSGRGWGHGVGMCQWGARGMALKGKNYREILTFYMPGTEIRKWSY